MAGAFILMLLAAQGADTSGPSIQGLWRSPGGNSIVSIAPCGDKFCGTIAWASAKAKHDSPKATNQLVGTQLLTNLVERSPGRWQGRLFIPDKNMRATAKIEMISPEQLKVSGCAAGKALCRSTLWNRFSEPLPVSE